MIIQPTETGVQEFLDTTETCHDPENVTGNISPRGPGVQNSVHTVEGSASESISVGNTSTERTPTQYGVGACVKRIRIPEQDDSDVPSTSRLRISENHGKR